MAQESSDDFNSKFSTLNVDAMEFVPNFGPSGDDEEDDSPVSAQAPAPIAAAAEVPEAAVAPPTTVPVAAVAPTTLSSSNTNSGE